MDKDINEYFQPKKNGGAISVLCISAFFVLVGLAAGEGAGIFAILGLVGVGIGIFMLYQNSQRMSDSAYDSYCAKKVPDIQREAMRRLSIDPDQVDMIPPVVFSGYNFENLFNARMAKMGVDGIWRSSIYEASCTYFSEEQVYYYGRRISMLTDETFDIMKEYFYTDIVSVTTTSDAYHYYLTINLGGESQAIPFSNRGEAENSADGLRNLIREAKRRAR